jgi:hypothetical protein
MALHLHAHCPCPPTQVPWPAAAAAAARVWLPRTPILVPISPLRPATRLRDRGRLTGDGFRGFILQPSGADRGEHGALCGHGPAGVGVECGQQRGPRTGEPRWQLPSAGEGPVPFDGCAGQRRPHRCVGASGHAAPPAAAGPQRDTAAWPGQHRERTWGGQRLGGRAKNCARLRGAGPICWRRWAPRGRMGKTTCRRTFSISEE